MINIPRRHSTQPQGRVQSDDPSLFLAAFAPSMFTNIANGGVARHHSGVKFVPGESGVAADYGAATGAFSEVDCRRAFDGIATARSWVAQVVVRAYNNGRIFDKNTTNSQVELFFISDQSALGYVYERTTSGTNQRAICTRDTSQINTLLSLVVAAPAIGVGMPRIYANGKELTYADSINAPSAGSGAITNNNDNYVIGNRLGAAERRLNGAVYMLAGYDRLFSDDEALEASRNPYQLFRADPVRIYSFPSGPIAIPTLSGASFAGRVPSVSLSY